MQKNIKNYNIAVAKIQRLTRQSNCIFLKKLKIFFKSN